MTGEMIQGAIPEPEPKDTADNSEQPDTGNRADGAAANELGNEPEVRIYNSTPRTGLTGSRP